MDVGGRHLDAAFAHPSDRFGASRLGVGHRQGGGAQGRRVVSLEPGCPEGDASIGDGVAQVEGVAACGFDGAPQVLGRLGAECLFGEPIGVAAQDRSRDEFLAEGVNDVLLLLGHGLA